MEKGKGDESEPTLERLKKRKKERNRGSVPRSKRVSNPAYKTDNLGRTESRGHQALSRQTRATPLYASEPLIPERS